MVIKAESRSITEEMERYSTLPYRIELTPDEGGWFVSMPDLPGCISQGSTPQEALEMIREAQQLWLQVALEDGRPVPLPGEEQEHSYSGKFNVRVPKNVHRDLVRAAQTQGVSLNLFVATTLARAVAGNLVITHIFGPPVKGRHDGEKGAEPGG